MVDAAIEISKLKGARDWVEHDARHVFPTYSSWKWFKHLHRRELVDSGAVMVRHGRLGDLINTDRIGPVIQLILQEESLKRIDNAAIAA